MSNEKEWVTPICGKTGRELKFEDKLQPGMQLYSKNKSSAYTLWLHLDKTDTEVADLLVQKRAIEKRLLTLHNQSPTSKFYVKPVDVKFASPEASEVMPTVEIMESESAY
tara:strand:+ start:271 stop:600 length:330 start_codon:yes stop_codon:yes gene_type:complete